MLDFVEDWKFVIGVFLLSKYFYVHLGYSLNDIVFIQLSPFHGGGIPLPGSCIVVKNWNARSKTTVRSKEGFPLKVRMGSLHCIPQWSIFLFFLVCSSWLKWKMGFGGVCAPPQNYLCLELNIFFFNCSGLPFILLWALPHS